MRNIICFILIASALLFTACTMEEASSAEKFKKTIQEELVDKKFHHIEETILQTLNGELILEQERHLYYHDGDFYVENVQNDNAFMYGIKFYSKGYIAQTTTPDEIKWSEVQNLQTLQTLDGLKSWFMSLGQEAFTYKDEHLTIEEKTDGITVTYDRSQEVTPSENEVNTSKETYYFDKKWNLIKIELVAEGMMAFENGLSGKMQVITTTKFMDTSKRDILMKIEDVYKNIK